MTTRPPVIGIMDQDRIDLYEHWETTRDDVQAGSKAAAGSKDNAEFTLSK